MSCNWPKRVRGSAVARCFEGHVKLEKQPRMRDQPEGFPSIKIIRKTPRSANRNTVVKRGMKTAARYQGRNHETRVRFFRSPMNAKLDTLDIDITKRLPAAARRECPRKITEQRHRADGDDKRKSSGTGRPSRGNVETRTTA